jgi:outer membrane protein assembly factor BamE
MKFFIAALLSCGLLGACSYVKPYKIEVNQGNYVTQEMVDRLKEGMTRSQVRNALGAPLLESTFHSNRWDYQYTLSRRGEPITLHQVTVVFDGDTLKSWEAKALPTSPVISRDPAIDLPKAEGPGFWQRLSDWWKK